MTKREGTGRHNRSPQKNSALPIADSLTSPHGSFALFENTPELPNRQTLSCWCGLQKLMRKCQYCGGNPIETLLAIRRAA